MKRGEVKGWSAGAVRRHTAWLYSVDADALAEDTKGFAFTLTLRDCPESAAAFHSLRRAWLKRLERAGVIRVHWVIEWQRRGVPHLHCAVYFPAGLENPEWIALFAWLAVAEPYGATAAAQDMKPIAGPLGWLKYLSKHASRGVRHYQRQAKPAGWEKSGRLWGHTGDWPEIAPMRFEMSKHAYWRYRRLVRAWRIADARASGDPKRIAYARRMLSCDDRRLSEVRGVSDWTPEDVTLALVALLAGDGEHVEQLE